MNEKEAELEEVKKRDASDSRRHSAPPFLVGAEARATVNKVSRTAGESIAQIRASSPRSADRDSIDKSKLGGKPPIEESVTSLVGDSCDFVPLLS